MRFASFAIIAIQIYFFVGFQSLNGQTLDSLISAYRSQKGEKKAETGFNLANQYLKSRNFDSALYFIDDALGNLPSKASTIKGNLIKLKGNTYLKRNQPNEALQWYEKALIIYQKADDREGVEAIYNNLGLVYNTLGDTDKSIEYLEKSAYEAEKNGNFVSQAKTLHNIGYHYEKLSIYDKALAYYLRSLKIKEQYDPQNIASTINNIGNIYYYTKDYQKALQFYERAYELSVEKKSPEEMAIRLSNVGMVLKYLGRTNEAIEKMIESLSMYEEMKDYSNLGRVQTLIGSFLTDVGDYERSQEYFYLAMNNYKLTGDSVRMAHTYFNVANSLSLQKKYSKAIEYLKQSIALFSRSKMVREKIFAFNSLVTIYSTLKNYPKALVYADSAIKLSENQQDRYTQLSSILSKSAIYLAQNNLEQALNYAKMAEKFDTTFQNSKTKLETYQLLSNIHREMNDYKKALDYYEKYFHIYDSVNNSELKEKITDIERRYQLKEKEKEIDQLTLEAAITQQKLKTRNILLILTIITVFLLLFSTYVTYKAYRHKKKTNEQLALYNAQILEQSEEIRAQRDSLEEQMELTQKQKLKIEQQHQALTDSLNYARQIQNSILPDKIILNQLWDDYFIVYLPKDIVSGDFYWTTKIGNMIYAAAIDCTGHGVPGALTSILAYNALQTAVKEYHLTEPSEILTFADKFIGKTFESNNDTSQPDKGMDIALCCFNRDSLELKFSGARSTAYIIRTSAIEFPPDDSDEKSVLIELKGTPKSAGTMKSFKFTGFTTQSFQLQKNDMIYLFSDGYADQFDEFGKKFYKAQLRENLIKYATFDVDVQKQKLEADFLNWKGEASQTDDVLIIGIKI